MRTNNITTVMLNSFQHLRLSQTLNKKEEILNQVQDDNINRTAHGFTLIELLIVILIIGVLVAVALPQYKLAVAKSKFTEAVSLVSNLKKQQELFFLANGYYASDCEELSPDLPAGGFITDNKKYIGFSNDEAKSLTCSLSYGTRVGMSTGADANLELWLDHVEGDYIENTTGNQSDKGWCIAITDIGHKLCAQMGTKRENISSYHYFF